jgi:hypothetical protein
MIIIDRMKNNDFYIGWMPIAPPSYARFIKRAIVLLGILVILAAVLLATQQRKFSVAKFEFGQLSMVTGVYQDYPVPSLKVASGLDIIGNRSFITVPLVGYGKFGAEGVIRKIEQERNVSLNKKEITVKGSLLYCDGKTILQVDGNDHPLIEIKSTPTSLTTTAKELGNLTLKGEILDPKCYFGVMKPGQGKPHRDCAIRCIAGGINPVLYVRDQKGNANYYLLVGEAGSRLNDELKDYIGEPVSVQARAVRHDDWVILFLSGKKNVQRLGGLSWFKIKDGIVSCDPYP